MVLKSIKTAVLLIISPLMMEFCLFEFLNTNFGIWLPSWLEKLYNMSFCRGVLEAFALCYLWIMTSLKSEDEKINHVCAKKYKYNQGWFQFFSSWVKKATKANRLQYSVNSMTEIILSTDLYFLWVQLKVMPNMKIHLWLMKFNRLLFNSENDF